MSLYNRIFRKRGTTKRTSKKNDEINNWLIFIERKHMKTKLKFGKTKTIEGMSCNTFEDSKLKHYTLPELKEKYWEFKKKLMETEVSYGGGMAYGGGGTSIRIVYKNTVEDFILWLEEK